MWLYLIHLGYISSTYRQHIIQLTLVNLIHLGYISST